MWDKTVFLNYKEIQPTPVETCNGTAYIVGEGIVSFKLGSEDINIKCKHAPDFNENVISLSKFVKKYNVDFKSSDKFEGCIISKDGKVIQEIKLKWMLSNAESAEA